MQSKSRIYKDKVSIKENEVKKFYDRRALIESKEAVMLGNPDSLKDRMDFDKDIIHRALDITQKSKVLDIGCGIGRIADLVLPLCGYYLGIDVSEQMIKRTEKICENYNTPYDLFAMSFIEFVTNKTPDINFDVAIIWCVCMYINDENLERIFSFLPNLLNDKSALYIADPVGIGERLTLTDFHSEELKTEYSAIYRTQEEYLNLYEPLFKAGFKVAEKGYLPDFGENYSDTKRWYAVLKR